MKMKRLRNVLATLLVAAIVSLSGCSLLDRNKAEYTKGLEYLSSGEYDLAIESFSEVGNYEDASKYLMYVRALKSGEEGVWEPAINSFISLGDFSDSSLQVIYYTARQAEAEQRYEEAEAQYKMIAMFRDSSERIAALPDLILDRDFAIVRNAILGEEMDERIADMPFHTFEELTHTLLKQTYSDSDTRMLDQFNTLADDALEAGMYDIACTIFLWLNEEGYEGADVRMLDAFFVRVQNLMANNDYASAEEILSYLCTEGYTAAEELLKECCYHLGVGAEEVKDYAAAYDYYVRAEGYKDSADKAERFESEYAAAEVLLADEKYEEAYAAFEKLYNYSDATARCQMICGIIFNEPIDLVPQIALPVTVGSSAEDIETLQQRLIELGWLKTDAANGVYDNETRFAVAYFQRYIKDYLDPSVRAHGYADEETIKWLYDMNAPQNPEYTPVSK